jgi:cbb3-type cytochrome oxidase subunit 3
MPAVDAQHAVPVADVAPAPETGAPSAPTSLHDPRVIQMLSTEHWSLLSARSLAYNEAFTRAGMFLAFLSTSFVALALIAQTIPTERDFLLVAALVLAFDLVIGVTTYGRIVGANYEDYLAVHGMARIRHSYIEIAPFIAPYFTATIHDDLKGVMKAYAAPEEEGPRSILYGMTTSGGMVALIVSMLGGVLALVVTMLVGAPMGAAYLAGAIAALVLFVGMVAFTYRFYARVQTALEARFPTPDEEA